ncbi:MAG: hypothetical protein HKN13_00535 [Rhodothermales bacterium]|nr:hypothetical protein [Rhodothermales bacterium]
MRDKLKIVRYLNALAEANERALARLFDPNNVPDRVVQWLLDAGVVTPAHVRPVYNAWVVSDDASNKVRLWRKLAEALPEKAEQVRAAAARVYAFSEVVVSTNDAVQHIETVFRNWSIEQWYELRDAMCLPIRLESIAGTDKQKFIFVSHDPTRIELITLLDDLGIEDFELRYTPEAVVTYLCDQLEPIVRESKWHRPPDVEESDVATPKSIKAA